MTRSIIIFLLSVIICTNIIIQYNIPTNIEPYSPFSGYLRCTFPLDYDIIRGIKYPCDKNGFVQPSKMICKDLGCCPGDYKTGNGNRCIKKGTITVTI